MTSPYGQNAASTLLLILAVAVLGLGPILFRLSRAHRWLLPVVDGFVLASVGALAAMFVLPEAVRVGGPGVLLLAGVGLLLPSVLERFSSRHQLVHGVGLLFALVGLLAHTVTDGVALSAGGSAARALALAVVLHRIPVALAAWWLVRPLYGVTGAWVVLSLEGIGTIVGFFLGDLHVVEFSGVGLAAFQAFVSGALLHVVIHRPSGPRRPLEEARFFRLAETGGAILGAVLVALVPHPHEDIAEGPHGIAAEYAGRFLDLALESAPALLLGYVLAGVFVVVLPRATLGWVARGGPLAHALRGTAFGIPIPICSCGVVPVYQGLVRRGVPASAAIAFLVATPELGIESLLLSLPLLGSELTGLRLLAAVVIAVVVGVVVGKVILRAPLPVEEESVESTGGGFAASLRRVLDFGLREVVDDTAGWILLGLAVAAAIEPMSLSEWLAGLPRGSDIVLFTLLGIPLYVCASGATPLAAAMLVAGLSPGAALAFLLSGPATNVTTFAVLSRLHGRRAATLFGVVVIGAAMVVGFIVNGVLSPAAVVSPVLFEDAHGNVAWGALFSLGAIYGAALLRQGPRGFLGNVLSLGQGADHDHDHDHDHDDHDDHDHMSGLGHEHGHGRDKNAHHKSQVGEGRRGSGRQSGLEPGGTRE